MSDTKTEIKSAYEKSHNVDAAHDSGGSFLGHIWASIGVTIVLGIICCAIYPAIVWGIGQTVFRYQANGSLVKKDGTPTTKDEEAVGSALIGQNFSAAGYFHPRPSAAGSGYDASASGGTNLGPLSVKLIHGTVKNVAVTVFAHDKSHPAIPNIPGRAEGTVAAVTPTSITIDPTPTPGSTATKTTYVLDPAVADPAAVVNVRGRTIRVTTLTAGAMVELKLNDKTPPAVIGINVFDQVMEDVPVSVDANGNKINLPPAKSPVVVNIPAQNPLVIVNGKADAKLGDITSEMTTRILVSVQEDFDGIADRIVHYCEDNGIDYQSSIASTEFKDQDGIDDSKLIQAMNAAPANPTISPAELIPGDAVTASASGLDPHISPRNAELQKKRVAKERGITPEQVQKLIDEHTDGRWLGLLGDPGVNVLLLNLSLDAKYPIPPAAPAAPSATAPSTAPATAPTKAP